MDNILLVESRQLIEIKRNQELKKSINIEKDEFISIISDYNKLLTSTENDMIIENNTAHIYINGFLQEEESNIFDIFFGFHTCSMKKIRNELKIAQEDNAVKEIILHINSSGGNVTGTDETAQAIRQIDKPITAIITGNCCSGAYYLGVNADKMIATSPNVIIGSIGVVTTITDYTKLYDNLGIIIHTITNTDSPNKQLKLGTDEWIESIQSLLDGIAMNFIETVAQGREVAIADVIKNYGKGDIFVAREAYKIGMIDDIMTVSYDIKNKRSQEIEPIQQKEQNQNIKLYPSPHNTVQITTGESTELSDMDKIKKVREQMGIH